MTSIAARDARIRELEAALRSALHALETTQGRFVCNQPYHEFWVQQFPAEIAEIRGVLAE